MQLLARDCGLVRSEWCTSEVGPARRTYSITSAGVGALSSQVRDLEHVHDVLHTFLERYSGVAPGRHDAVPARRVGALHAHVPTHRP